MIGIVIDLNILFYLLAKMIDFYMAIMNTNYYTS